LLGAAALSVPRTNGKDISPPSIYASHTTDVLLAPKRQWTAREMSLTEKIYSPSIFGACMHPMISGEHCKKGKPSPKLSGMLV
jgi:hypothetical protein